MKIYVGRTSLRITGFNGQERVWRVWYSVVRRECGEHGIPRSGDSVEGVAFHGQEIDSVEGMAFRGQEIDSVEGVTFRGQEIVGRAWHSVVKR